MKTPIDCEKEFCDEEFIESDVIAEGLLVAPNDDEELTETCCANTLFSEEDLASGCENLELSPHLVKVARYVNLLL